MIDLTFLEIEFCPVRTWIDLFCPQDGGGSLVLGVLKNCYELVLERYVVLDVNFLTTSFFFLTTRREGLNGRDEAEGNGSICDPIASHVLLPVQMVVKKVTIRLGFLGLLCDPIASQVLLPVHGRQNSNTIF